MLFTRAIFSEEVAPNNDTIGFLLKRLEKDMAVEIRNKEGRILVCGNIAYHTFEADKLHISVVNRSEALPDCPKDKETHTAQIPVAEIGYAEIVTPLEEYYVYEGKEWRNARWSKPVRQNQSVFQESAGVPSSWRRYSRPPKAIPGVFWPEIRLSSGIYAMTRTQDTGVPVTLALEFRVHRSLYRLGLFVESAYYGRLYNGNPEAVSGYQLVSVAGGVRYAFWQRREISFGATFSTGMIQYFFNGEAESGTGIRPVVGVGFMAAWHILHNNRDAHKISLFLHPVANLVFNRDDGAWLRYPLLLEMRAGVQYSY